jgi:hypothetical protein
MMMMSKEEHGLQKKKLSLHEVENKWHILNNGAS